MTAPRKPSPKDNLEACHATALEDEAREAAELARLDAMSDEEIARYLADHGVDVADVDAQAEAAHDQGAALGLDSVRRVAIPGGDVQRRRLAAPAAPVPRVLPGWLVAAAAAVALTLVGAAIAYLLRR